MTQPELTFNRPALENIVRKFAWATRDGSLDLDDLRQVGWCAVEKARAWYDPARCNTAFGSFAFRIVAQAIAAAANEQRQSVYVPYGTRLWRLNKGKQDVGVRCTPVAVRDSDGAYVDELLDLRGIVTQSDAESTAEASELAEHVEAALRAVGRRNARWAEILRLFFFEGMTQEAVGEHLGFTRERARQLKERALDEFAHQWARKGLWAVGV
jgi:RNA polymerase sigma factor (sigma-70 family)